MSQTRTISSEDDLQAGLFVTFSGMLLAVGILMVYSSSITASPSADEQTFLVRQMSFLLIAGLTGIALSRLPAGWWKLLAPWLYLATICLLILVLVPGIGRSVNGAQRWLRLGPVSFQPSESAKLTVPLLLCQRALSRRLNSRWRPGPLLIDAALALLPMGLILVEPDLGTALFVGLTAAICLWLCGCPSMYFASAGICGIPPALLLCVLKPYQIARLRGFVDTWLHPEAAPYQIQQSLMTLGVGGLTGVGLGRGWQKLSFLPEANTDFVVAVVGEELGLAGTLGIVALWIGIYLCGMQLVRRAANGSFERVVSMTLLWGLIIQAAINMAVITALVPPKGISHPFISYGGSNLGLSIVCLGVIVGLTRLPERPAISDNTGWPPD